MQYGIFNLFTGGATSVTSKATVKKKAISGSGSFVLSGDPQTASFTIASKTSGKTRTLTINYAVTNSSGTFPFQFVVSGKAKK